MEGTMREVSDPIVQTGSVARVDAFAHVVADFELSEERNISWTNLVEEAVILPESKG